MPHRKTLLFHVSNFLRGGIEKVLIELLRALDPDKYRLILVIAYDLGEAEFLRPQLPPHVEIRRVLDRPWMNRVRRKKMTSHLSGVEKAFYELFLPAVIRRQHLRKYRHWKQEADVIIDFDATLAPYIDTLSGVRTAAYCHFAFHTLWDGRKSKRDRLARRLAQYDTVVMLCEEMKEEAARLYPALAPRLVRIYNALDFEKVAARSREWPADWQYLQQLPYLVAVGRMTEDQKDFTTVVKAYAAAQREKPFPEKLVIVGEGGDRPAIESLAMAEGVGEQVVFTGYQPNPFPFVAGAKAFLFGSKYEGLPTVLIEAHALRIPVVATQCPTGVRELMGDGQAGILVPMGDVTAMKEGILQLVFEAAVRARCLAESEKLLPWFDIRRVVQEFEKKVVDRLMG